MLATLFKDERCQQLPAYSILEKMYLDRIIRRSELQEFESLMQTHQKVKLEHITFFFCSDTGPSFDGPQIWEINIKKGINI